MNAKTSLKMTKDISQPWELITEHIDIWTSAILAKSTSGRGSSKKYELYGITKLRELILELAVRGKLVPQDTNDEPASLFLEKIAVEKAELIKKGEIRKSKSLPKISKKEQPFDLPLGWEWIHINEIVSLENGDRGKNYPNKSALVDKGIPFINAGQLEGGVVSKKELSYITQDRFDILNGGKFRNGDILFCLRGSLGKCALVSNFGIGAIASSLIIMRPIMSRLEHFIMLVLNSTLTKIIISKYNNGTAQPNLSGADLAKFPVPLPPLAEQHRIVAKVDELMMLCDQLEQQTEASIEAHATLAEVLLATLTDSVDADELAQNWVRIAEHFDSLFTTEQSIEALKKAVLQLAVIGKLVAQNPDDEPASVLLEKERLIRESKIKKPSSWLEITENEKLFESPESWIWLRFGDVYPLEYGNNLPKLKRSNTGEYNVYGSNGIVGSHNAECVKSPCIVLGRKGSAGALNISLDDGCWVTDVAYSCIPTKGIDLHFAFMHLKTLGLDSLGKGIKPGLNRNEAYSLPVAIPPLSEQHRIVAKVDELMAICDQLKEKLQQSQETQVQLTNALVDRALG